MMSAFRALTAARDTRGSPPSGAIMHGGVSEKLLASTAWRAVNEIKAL
jgi:hypothetical protein